MVIKQVVKKKKQNRRLNKAGLDDAASNIVIGKRVRKKTARMIESEMQEDGIPKKW